MRRRTFIGSLAVTAVGIAPLIHCRSEEQDLDLIHRFINQNDKRVERILATQQLDKTHPFFGGFPDRYDIYHHSSPAGNAKPERC